jgi:O-antigen ligase
MTWEIAQPWRGPALTRVLVAVGIVALALAAVLTSHISTSLFILSEGLVVALAALGSLRWPRALLVGVVLSPILDRFLVPDLLAGGAQPFAHLLPEALLAAVSTALLLQAARRGRLWTAFRHPAFPLALLFVGLAGLSAVVNHVPVVQAVAGIAFTLDAVPIFFVARTVGFGTRQVVMAIGVLMGVVLAGALVALSQALFTPDLFGLSPLQGRFGELYRLAAFFRDPNTLAAFLSASIPFSLFAATRLPVQRSRRIALAAAFVLLLALWLSFSRGGWLGAVGGFSISALVFDRRALRIGLLVMVASLVVAVVMPRNLACPDCAHRLDVFGSTFGRVDAIGSGRDLRTLFIANAVPILRDHALIGVGPGRYGGAAANIFGTPIYAQYGTDRLFTNPTQRTVDGFWLHIWIEGGTAGLLAFLGIIAATLRPVFRSARTAAGGTRIMLAGLAAAVIALSLNGLTTMLLEANSGAFLFWFMLGVGSQLAVAPMRADARAGALAAC